jgi:Holliday junction resolvase RusA-like endonuclease
LKKSHEWDAEYTIPIEPVPAARPRVSRWGAYYPKRYRDFKAALAAAFIAAARPAPVRDGPCRVEVEIVAPRPASTKLPFPKPDIDNYLKSVFDAATGSVWEDDWGIRECSATKRWTEKGEDAHVRLKVKWK